ncbi:MAG: DUF4241 domain-containing protein [Coriobacteriia bacterium]|nr:DUF4241 domain-containing protein [Coriobacteriia bacterium]
MSNGNTTNMSTGVTTSKNAKKAVEKKLSAYFFAPSRDTDVEALLVKFKAITLSISPPTQNRRGDEVYTVHLKDGSEATLCVYGQKHTASHIRAMRYLYKSASYENEEPFEYTMRRIEGCSCIIECQYMQGEGKRREETIHGALLAAAQETEGIASRPDLRLFNGSEELLFSMEGASERVLESTAFDVNEYFAVDEALGQRFARMSLGRLSLPTGELIACDFFVTFDLAQPFSYRVTPGEYEVEAAVAVPDGDYDYIAAVRVRFSDAQAVRFESALEREEKTDSKNADKSSVSDSSLGLFIDAGLACICDQKAQAAALRAFSDIEARRGDDFEDIYTDYFEDLLEQNTKKKYYNQNGEGVCCDGIEDISCLDWTVPGTDYHIPVFSTGYGDGAYPVWFGFDENGKVCSLLMGFIDLKAEGSVSLSVKKPGIMSPLLVLVAAVALILAGVFGLMTGESLKVLFFHIHPVVMLVIAALILIGAAVSLVKAIKKRKAFRKKQS